MKIPVLVAYKEMGEENYQPWVRWTARAVNSAHTATGASRAEALDNLRHAIVEDYHTGSVTLSPGQELIHIEV